MLTEKKLDWKADPWFSRTVADKLTDEFKVWWVDLYSTPFEYPDNPGEQHEYWVRCGFAFMGWQGARGVL